MDSGAGFRIRLDIQLTKILKWIHNIKITFNGFTMTLQAALWIRTTCWTDRYARKKNADKNKKALLQARKGILYSYKSPEILPSRHGR